MLKAVDLESTDWNDHRFPLVYLRERRRELVMAMTQMGRPTLASIDRTLVRTNFS